MKEIDTGHLYKLDNLKEAGVTELRFYKDSSIHGEGWSGPSMQEVLRACIARVHALEAEQPAPENAKIVYHLRQAIIGFEVRALRVKLENHPDGVEAIQPNAKGHIFRVESPND